MYQAVWDQAPFSAAEINEPASYRSGYGSGLLKSMLREQVRTLHDIVGNAETNGYQIVFGSGATDLIGASLYALSNCSAAPGYVFVKAPYYSAYRERVEFGISTCQDLIFTNDETMEDEYIIEIITTPNNPTGEHRKPVYENSLQIYDMVYNWPSLTGIDMKHAGPVMLFSMSKLSGHAGLRLGWALVKDPAVAERMRDYIGVMQIQVSNDVLHRAWKLLSVLNQADNAKTFFAAIKSKMITRWEQILGIIGNSNKVQVESVANQFYGWIKCTDLAYNQTCYDYLLQAQLAGYLGSEFGGTDEYVRLEFVEYDAVWDIIMQRLKSFFH